MTEPKITLVKCARIAGDMQFGVEVVLGDGENAFADAVAVGWKNVNAVVAAHSQKHSKYEQPVPAPVKPVEQPASDIPPITADDGDTWFIDTSTGEAFDCADEDEFKRAIPLVFKAKQFTKGGTDALIPYVLKNAGVSRFGEMKPPARRAFLDELLRGKFDTFKTASAGNGQS